jgi:DJ-1 family protein
MIKKALVLVADGSEEIEVATAVDILRRGKIQVDLAAVSGSTSVLLSRQMRLTADNTLNSIVSDQSEVDGVVSFYDAIVLPGGLAGAKTFAADPTVLKLLKKFESQGKLVAAMCASTTVLKAAGIGQGKRATSYPSFKGDLSSYYDYQDRPVVVDIRLITSRAPGTAMAWALAIVKDLVGRETAAEIHTQCLGLFNLAEIDGGL